MLEGGGFFRNETEQVENPANFKSNVMPLNFVIL